MIESVHESMRNIRTMYKSLILKHVPSIIFFLDYVSLLDPGLIGQI